MTAGIFSALALLFSLLVESTLVAALPTPWREIPLPFIVGLVIMYRLSQSLGLAFLLLVVIIAYVSGFGSQAYYLAYLAAAFSALFFLNWVFARHSLVAMGGFAFVTTAVFIGTKIIVEIIGDLTDGAPVYLGSYLLHFLFVSGAGAIIIIALSMALSAVMKALGNRFMRRNISYEITGR